MIQIGKARAATFEQPRTSDSRGNERASSWRVGNGGQKKQRPAPALLTPPMPAVRSHRDSLSLIRGTMGPWDHGTIIRTLSLASLTEPDARTGSELVMEEFPWSPNGSAANSHPPTWDRMRAAGIKPPRAMVPDHLVTLRCSETSEFWLGPAVSPSADSARWFDESLSRACGHICCASCALANP